MEQGVALGPETHIGSLDQKIFATWAKQDTFLRCYRVELLSPQDLAFGRKVLQAVVPP